jgi:hypothetical protein
VLEREKDVGGERFFLWLQKRRAVSEYQTIFFVVEAEDMIQTVFLVVEVLVEHAKL